MKHRFAFMIVFCLVLAIQTMALAQSPLLDPTNIPTDSFGVDLRDIITYKARLAPTAKVLVNAIRTKSEVFVDKKLAYSLAGPGVDVVTRTNVIFGVEVTALTLDSQSLPEFITLSILYHHVSQGLQIRHVRAKIVGEEVTDVALLQQLSVKDLKFRLQVSLVQRKLILHAEEQGVFKIYPLGVGGFDEGVRTPGVKIVTDVIPDAIVNPKLMALSVTQPSYFMGRPFIVITRADGTRTGLGFHYSITPTLQRGFVSHGCMRMVDKDLYELFAILEANRQLVELALLQNSDIPYEHPYPLLNTRYNSVKNYGTSESPSVRRGKDGLVIMPISNKAPPIENLITSPADNQFENFEPWTTEGDVIWNNNN